MDIHLQGCICFSILLSKTLDNNFRRSRLAFEAMHYSSIWVSEKVQLVLICGPGMFSEGLTLWTTTSWKKVTKGER
jgi:hypothetical protein